MKKNIIFIFLFSIARIGIAQSVTELGFYSPLISSFDMDYTSDHLVITQQGLKIFDVSNPGNPQQVGTATYPGNYAYVIDVNDHYAYMAEGGSGYFSVYDISSLSSPTLLGSVAIPSTEFAAGDLISNNTTAYMTALDSLYVIDVTNPSVPVFVNSQQVVGISFGAAKSVVVIDSSLFVLHSAGITVFDISNPLVPVVIDTLPLTHGYHTGLAVDTIGHRLFSPWADALQTYLGFDAYDVSDPHLSNLLFSDSTNFGSGEFGMSDFYNNLLIISRGGGVVLFDASNGMHGFLTSYSGVNVPNSTVSIEIRDSVFYNSRRGGFEILQFNGSFPSTVVENVTSKKIIYPNPISNTGQIHVTGFESGTKATLLSLEGRVLLETIIDKSEEIQLPELATGIYLMHFKNDHQLTMNKIIVE